MQARSIVGKNLQSTSGVQKERVDFLYNTQSPRYKFVLTYFLRQLQQDIWKQKES